MGKILKGFVMRVLFVFIFSLFTGVVMFAGVILNASLSVSPAGAAAGQDVTVQMLVTNIGDATALNVFPVSKPVQAWPSFLVYYDTDFIGPQPSSPQMLTPSSSAVFQWVYKMASSGLTSPPTVFTCSAQAAQATPPATIYSNEAASAPIPTATVTLTTTLTPTLTSTPVCFSIIDDLEDGNEVNKLGQSWFTYDDNAGGGNSTVNPAASATFAPQAPGALGSNYCAGMTGTLGTAGPTTYIGMGTVLNMSGMDINSVYGIRFWAKGDNRTYKIKIMSAAPEFLLGNGDNMYGTTFIAGASWQLVEIPLINFTQEAGWGTAVDRSTAFAKASQMVFEITGTGTAASIDLSIDNLAFNECLAPVTSTFTPTLTYTYTQSPVTITATDTPMATYTATLFSGTDSPTCTPTLIASTPTPMVTYTATLGAGTATPTCNCLTLTATATLTPFAPTYTFTTVPPSSPTAMVTYTPTYMNVTGTATSMPSNTPTCACIYTATITATRTVTIVPPSTPTCTATTPPTGQADLVITGLSDITMYPVPACVPSGGPYPALGINVTYKNQGTGSSAGCVISVGGVTATASVLNAGQSANIWIAGGFSAGSITAVIDATGLVSESNESNNTYIQVVAIPTLPPACVASPTPSTDKQGNVHVSAESIIDPDKGGKVNLKYDVKDNVDVKIIVYDRNGKKVKTLVNTMKAAGAYSTDWKGVFEDGKIVSAGVYVIYVKIGNYEQKLKIAVKK